MLLKYYSSGQARTTRIIACCSLRRHRRRKLAPLTWEGLEGRVAGPGAPRGAVCVVCVLAHWNPVCERLEQRELQGAAWELEAEAEAAGPASDAAHVQVGACVCD